MAITSKEYDFLWKDIISRKGGQYEKEIISWIKQDLNYKKEITSELKWLCYRLDQDIRSHAFKYFEVIEKALHKLLQDHDLKKWEEISNSETPWSTSKLMCAINQQDRCYYKDRCKNKSIHKDFKNLKISNNFSNMHIFNSDDMTDIKKMQSEIPETRNKCQHFSFILNKWFKDGSDLDKLLSLFNFHYKHSFALNSLAKILSRFTTKYNDFSKKIIEQNTWLFNYAKSIENDPEYIKLTEEYLDIVKKYNKFKYEDYNSLAIKFLELGIDSKYAFMIKKHLSESIEDYLREYINYITISYYKSKKIKKIEQ